MRLQCELGLRIIIYRIYSFTYGLSCFRAILLVVRTHCPDRLSTPETTRDGDLANDNNHPFNPTKHLHFLVRPSLVCLGPSNLRSTHRCIAISSSLKTSHLLASTFVVGVHVELYEQIQEQNTLRNGEIHIQLRIATIVEERDATVNHCDDELSDLQLGEVLLPPEVLLHVGSKRREKVVRVHYDVDKGVETDDERRMAVGADAVPEPAVEHDEAVVHHVEG